MNGNTFVGIGELFRVFFRVFFGADILFALDLPHPAEVIVELFELLLTHPANEFQRQDLFDEVLRAGVFEPAEFFESVHISGS